MIDFSRFTIHRKYANNQVFFDFNLQEFTGHKGISFKGFASLKVFLENNPNRNIHITLDQVQDFSEEGDKLIINLKSYQDFSKSISQSSKNRFQAFLAQKLKRYTDAEKSIIIAGSTEEEIIERIKNFTQDEKSIFLDKLKSVSGIVLPVGEIANVSNEEFLRAFSSFIKDPSKQRIILDNYPQIQINILENHKKFLEKNLDKDETFIQNWIDGKIDDNGNQNNLNEDEVKKIKKSRSLIFGLEFISHKREGYISGKKFDILTRISQGKNDYVLIELKSPSSDVFKIVSVTNQNEGQSEEYHLSSDTSRAIPQISDYRNLLESATDLEWQRIGLQRGKVSKCLIIIGTKKDNPVWVEHFSSLRKNLSSTIEILTYTDLIHKLETTISNLKENL